MIFQGKPVASMMDSQLMELLQKHGVVYLHKSSEGDGWIASRFAEPKEDPFSPDTIMLRRQSRMVYSPGQAESRGVPPPRYVPAAVPSTPLTAEEIAGLRRWQAGADLDDLAESQIRRALDELEERRARYGDHLDVMEIAHKDGTVARAWIGRARELLKRIRGRGRGAYRGSDVCPECGAEDEPCKPGCELDALLGPR
jgi:hypothetical protein